jgi:type II secretory pathway component PulJ
MSPPRRGDARARPSITSGDADPACREAGFTVIELVVTSAILLVIVAAMLSLLVAGQRMATFVARRGQTQDDVRLAMDRVTKDLRQLTRFRTSFTPTSSGSWTGNDLDFETYTPGNPSQPVRVRWWVSGDSLYREVFTPAGVSAGTVVVLSDLTPAGAGAPDVFTTEVLPDTDPVTGGPVPWQLTVTLTVDLTDPGGTYSVQSQVQLRNLQIPRPLP